MNRFFLALILLVHMSAHAQISFIAHRGASYLAPENTEASLDLAWQFQSDGAECDIMLTRDKKIIVFHDRNGERLLNTDIIIRDTKYKDLRKLPITLRDSNEKKYAGSTIPLLKNILKKLPSNQFLVIEIKDEMEILPYLNKVIKKYWKSGKIAFIAFDYPTIKATKTMFPEIPCYYLSSSLEDIDQRFEDLAKSQLDGVDLSYKIINAELVDRFRRANKEVWCWTVNTVEDAMAMQKAGVSYITTDRPAWLREQMSKR
ncbi:MAG: hypothetical protein HKN76_01375 [Saprospiraceae bacterium]|nr:hypothetical protein [Saprospiraceae bacterium]